MKIAITGKGGTGKSTITALIAKVLRDQGRKVIILDADPDMNMAMLLGFPEDAAVKPISELTELIAERTETKPGESAPLFKMNPRVDDIPESYCLEKQGIKLLAMGTMAHGGGGCACPANAFVKSLVSHLILARQECILLDMEAGIEHLGRGTASGVDIMLVVVDTGKTSIATAHRIMGLSRDIGIKKLLCVANRVRSERDIESIKSNLNGLELLGHIGFHEELGPEYVNKHSLLDIQGKPLEQVRGLVEAMLNP